MKRRVLFSSGVVGTFNAAGNFDKCACLKWKECIVAGILSYTSLMGHCYAQYSKMQQLPLPPDVMPENPALPPSIVGTNGIRLPVPDNLEVIIDSGRKRILSNAGDTWIINYPGLDRKKIASLAGFPEKEVRNWYWKGARTTGSITVSHGSVIPKLEGSEGPEKRLIVAVPGYQGQIKPSSRSTLSNINDAIALAEAGDTIYVYPGVYRENVKISKSGRRTAPLRLVGVPDANGKMPTISGNRIMNDIDWLQFYDGSGRNLYQSSDIANNLFGPVFVDEISMQERAGVDDLKKVNTVAFSWGSPELRSTKDIAEIREMVRRSNNNVVAEADDAGWFDLQKTLGTASYSAILVGRAYVYSEADQEGRFIVAGDIRSSRRFSESGRNRLNRYRFWLNGISVSPIVQSTDRTDEFLLPHFSAGAQAGEQMLGINLKRGWNELLFHIDTTASPSGTRFSVTMPRALKRTSVASDSTTVSPAVLVPMRFLPLLRLSWLGLSNNERKIFLHLPFGKTPRNSTIETPYQRGAIITVEGSFVEVSGFEIKGGAQGNQQPLLTVSGKGSLISNNRFIKPAVRAITVSAFGYQRDEPIVVRQNWIDAPGHIGIGASGEPAGSNANLAAESLGSPDMNRGRYIIEDNTIINSNRNGYPVFWESGCIKAVRSSGSVIRGNICLGNNGTGIWLDWENFFNRIEGNVIVRAWGCGICVEASPGPNLIANNLIVGTRAGNAWMRSAILAWDGTRSWAINNIVDSGNASDTISSIGINLSGNNAWRDSRFGDGIKAKLEQFSFNNQVFGSTGNAKESEDVIFKNNLHLFHSLYGEDMDLNELMSAYGASVTRSGIVPFGVKHDISGLLRDFNGPTIGAFRTENRVVLEGAGTLEVEFEDGTVKRTFLN